MSTNAQRARNARKRAKLKAHKRAEAKRTVASWETARYVVTCRETSLWYSWEHKEYFPVEEYLDMLSPEDPKVEAWLDTVLSKFAPGTSKIVPGTFQVSLQCKFIEDTVWDDLSEFLSANLAGQLETRAAERNLCA